MATSTASNGMKALAALKQKKSIDKKPYWTKAEFYIPAIIVIIVAISNLPIFTIEQDKNPITSNTNLYHPPTPPPKDSPIFDNADEEEPNVVRSQNIDPLVSDVMSFDEYISYAIENNISPINPYDQLLEYCMLYAGVQGLAYDTSFNVTEGSITLLQKIEYMFKIFIISRNEGNYDLSSVYFAALDSIHRSIFQITRNFLKFHPSMSVNRQMMEVSNKNFLYEVTKMISPLVSNLPPSLNRNLSHITIDLNKRLGRYGQNALEVAVWLRLLRTYNPLLSIGVSSEGAIRAAIVNRDDFSIHILLDEMKLSSTLLEMHNKYYIRQNIQKQIITLNNRMNFTLENVDSDVNGLDRLLHSYYCNDNNVMYLLYLIMKLHVKSTKNYIYWFHMLEDHLDSGNDGNNGDTVGTVLYDYVTGKPLKLHHYFEVSKIDEYERNAENELNVNSINMNKHLDNDSRFIMLHMNIYDKCHTLSTSHNVKVARQDVKETKEFYEDADEDDYEYEHGAVGDVKVEKKEEEVGQGVNGNVDIASDVITKDLPEDSSSLLKCYTALTHNHVLEPPSSVATSTFTSKTWTCGNRNSNNFTDNENDNNQVSLEDTKISSGGYIDTCIFMKDTFSSITSKSQSFPVHNNGGVEEEYVSSGNIDSDSSHETVTNNNDNMNDITVNQQQTQQKQQKQQEAREGDEDSKPKLPRCNIDILYNSNLLSPEDFVKVYVGLKRPVILRGLLDGQTNSSQWTFNALKQKFGHHTVSVRKIPYADSLSSPSGQGVENNNGKDLIGGNIPLKSYIQYMREYTNKLNSWIIKNIPHTRNPNNISENSLFYLLHKYGGLFPASESSRDGYDVGRNFIDDPTIGIPGYVFDDNALPQDQSITDTILSPFPDESEGTISKVHTKHLLQELVEASGRYLYRGQYNVDINPRYSITKQLFVGPAFSGAPFHYHAEAFNALLYGRKLWMLSPPNKDVFSNIPSSIWSKDMLGKNIAEVFPYFQDGGFLPCYFEQYPGDVVFAPALWTHQIINLAESVGFAIEIQYNFY